MPTFVVVMGVLSCWLPYCTASRCYLGPRLPASFSAPYPTPSVALHLNRKLWQFTALDSVLTGLQVVGCAPETRVA
jgi:hypothetical protein